MLLFLKKNWVVMSFDNKDKNTLQNKKAQRIKYAPKSETILLFGGLTVTRE
jgi:hypothetical protein